jgi:hypothetical protein
MNEKFVEMLEDNHLFKKLYRRYKEEEDEGRRSKMLRRKES